MSSDGQFRLSCAAEVAPAAVLEQEWSSADPTCNDPPTSGTRLRMPHVQIPGMKLARKITIGLTATIVVVMALCALYLNSHKIDLYQGDLHDMARRGENARKVLQTLWQRPNGPAVTSQVVEAIGDVDEDVDVRWVSLDAKPGAPDHADLSAADRKTLAEGKLVSELDTEHADEPLRISYIPMEAGKPDVLEVTRHLKREISFVRTTQAGILMATLGVVLACALTALGPRLLAGRPPGAAAARRRGASAPATSPAASSSASATRSASSAREINAMCERLAEAQHAARRRDRGAHRGARAAAPRRSADHRRPARLGRRARARHAAQRGLGARRDDRRSASSAPAGRVEPRAHHRRAGGAHDRRSSASCSTSRAGAARAWAPSSIGQSVTDAGRAARRPSRRASARSTHRVGDAGRRRSSCSVDPSADRSRR